MLFKSDDHLTQVLAKLSLISLYILLACNFVMVVIGYFISQYHPLAANSNPMLRNIFFVLMVAEMAAIFLVRNFMLKRIARSHPENEPVDDKVLYRELFNITIAVVAMCSAISIFGLILVILGEDFKFLILFVAISLVGYQFFRLRPRDFEDKL